MPEYKFFLACPRSDSSGKAQRRLHRQRRIMEGTHRQMSEPYPRTSTPIPFRKNVSCPAHVKEGESEERDAVRASHTPTVRSGPPLSCNYCWNTVDVSGRIMRRKTQYHCPECGTNLCIVPCFYKYHDYLRSLNRHEPPN